MFVLTMVDTGKPGVYLFTKFDFEAVFHYN